MDIHVVVPPLPGGGAFAHPPSLLVLHATAGGTAKGAIDTLRQRGLSYHAIGEKDGRIFKCRPLSKIAYHAGNSYGPHEAASGLSRVQDRAKKFVVGCSVNDYSLGYSFVNLDDGRDPYTEAQIKAATEWVHAVRQQYPDLKLITTHAIVSPGRKIDPLGFAIEHFAERVGMKVWRYS